MTVRHLQADNSDVRNLQADNCDCASLKVESTVRHLQADKKLTDTVDKQKMATVACEVPFATELLKIYVG